MSIKASKAALRTQILENRNKLEFNNKKAQSQSICLHLIEFIAERKPKVVHLFLPMKDEVDIYPVIHYLLENNVTVVAPKTLKNRMLEHLVLKNLNELEDGIFGTKHPSNSIVYTGNYDIIIVPGLAFDTNGNRLGYGAGYYDTFLAEHGNVLKVAVCFDFQNISKIPVELHDVRMNSIVASDKIIHI